MCVKTLHVAGRQYVEGRSYDIITPMCLEDFLKDTWFNVKRGGSQEGCAHDFEAGSTLNNIAASCCGPCTMAPGVEVVDTGDHAAVPCGSLMLWGLRTLSWTVLTSSGQRLMLKVMWLLGLKTTGTPATAQTILYTRLPTSGTDNELSESAWRPQYIALRSCCMALARACPGAIVISCIFTDKQSAW